MAACPICHTDIEIGSQHYGTLFTCPSCNAVFFVDWGGQPEGANPDPTPDLAEPLEPVIGEEFSPLTPSEVPSEAPVSEFQNSIPEYQASDIPQTLNEEVPAYDFSQPMPMMDPTEPVIETPQSPQSVLSEITDFGNTDVNQAAFSYTVTISGIDSAAVFAQVKEALTDSKFGWNIIQVMTQMKDGVLTIRSVNAVKASIIVQRIKYLPVSINWRQDVLSSHS